MDKYLVLTVEHTDDFGNPPTLLGVVNTYEEALEMRKSHLQSHIIKFPEDELYDDGDGVYSTNEDGVVTYSQIVNIVKVDMSVEIKSFENDRF